LTLAAHLYDIRSLSHAYGGKPVLTIDRLSIPPTSILGLIGPNGSGKSTLLKLLGLIEKPTSGDIFYNGHRVEPFSITTRFQVTMLPQEPFLMKRSVFNNVAYGLKLRGNGTDKVAVVKEALSMVGLNSDAYIHRPWFALSGGEAQRVALAARLALKPKVLLMDEPTASVDAASAQLIKEASLRARQEWGTTLIIASHDWQWLHEICDEVIHLFEGRIFGSGRENIIFGPWQSLENNRWGKILPDGQMLVVPKPPQKTSAAVIELLSANGNQPMTTSRDVVLSGTVSRLSLERKTGQIIATILVGDLPFTLRLTPGKTVDHLIFPGQEISFRYIPETVKWV
jgi:tungstate transport system ATP-binding protein